MGSRRRGRRKGRSSPGGKILTSMLGGERESLPESSSPGGKVRSVMLKEGEGVTRHSSKTEGDRKMNPSRGSSGVCLSIIQKGSPH